MVHFIISWHIHVFYDTFWPSKFPEGSHKEKTLFVHFLVFPNPRGVLTSTLKTPDIKDHIELTYCYMFRFSRFLPKGIQSINWMKKLLWNNVWRINEIDVEMLGYKASHQKLKTVVLYHSSRKIYQCKRYFKFKLVTFFK